MARVVLRQGRPRRVGGGGGGTWYLVPSSCVLVIRIPLLLLLGTACCHSKGFGHSGPGRMTPTRSRNSCWCDALPYCPPRSCPPRAPRVFAIPAVYACGSRSSSLCSVTSAPLSENHRTFCSRTGSRSATAPSESLALWRDARLLSGASLASDKIESTVCLCD